MRFMGQLEHGLYMTNEVTIHPDVIQHYLGFAGQSNSQMSSSLDSDTQEWEDIPLDSTDLTTVATLVAEEQATQILHEGAQVPNDDNPFPTPQAEMVFQDAFERLHEMEHIPSGFGILEEEWGEDGYPETEVIHSRRQGKKELIVELPHFIWQPRAIRWCQSLAVLNSTLEIIMDTE